MSKSRSKSRSPSADLADLVKSRKSSSSKSDSKSKEPDAKSADSKGNGIKKGDDDRDRKSSGKPKIKPAIVFPGEDSTTKPRAPIKPACANDDELEDKSSQKSLSDQDEEKRRKRAEKYGTGGVGGGGGVDTKPEGNGKLKSPRLKSPKRSPKLSPTVSPTETKKEAKRERKDATRTMEPSKDAPATTDTGAGTGKEGQSEAVADKTEPDRKKFKVRIGQRDDLEGSK